MDSRADGRMMVEVGHSICETVFPVLRDEKRAIFLVGGSLEQEGTIRKKLLGILANREELNVYMPELMFSTLFRRPTYDLLSLENTLAESVHCVAICAESPGSLVELGAFVNHERLRRKLIVIVNERHKKDDSFIRHGPLRLLRRRGSHRVIWFNDAADPDCLALGGKVTKAIREVANHNEIRTDLQNPILSELFILCMLYFLGDVQWQALREAIESTAGDDCKVCALMADAMKETLIKRRIVLAHNGILSLTREGVDHLRDLVGHGGRRLTEDMDRIRIDLMNRILRRRLLRAGSTALSIP